MEKTKVLKVLIINEKRDVAYAISVELIPMLSLTFSDLGFAWDFIHSKDVDSVKQSEKYDLIFFEGGLRKLSNTTEFIGKIFELNPKAIVFFMPMGITEKDGKDCKLSVYLLKDYKDSHSYQIFSPDDLNEIKHTIERNISYQLPKDKLFFPLRTFSETCIKLTPSEKEAKDKCDLVAKELIKNHIFFSIEESDGMINILVDSNNLPMAKMIAEESSLDFWKKWLKKYFSGSL